MSAEDDAELVHYGATFAGECFCGDQCADLKADVGTSRADDMPNSLVCWVECPKCHRRTPPFEFDLTNFPQAVRGALTYWNKTGPQ